MKFAVTVACGAASALVGIICFAVVGGVFCHIGGGWLAVPEIPGDNYFTHDLVLRLIFSLPTGIVVLSYSRPAAPSSCISRAVLTASLCIWGLLSLYTGWDSYFSLGNEAVGTQVRTGVFDWLVGAPQVASADNMRQRWLRDAAGMALRGIEQTALPGFLIAVFSASLSGSSKNSGLRMTAAAVAYTLSGAVMALVYEVGQLPSADPEGSTAWLGPFQPGIPLSELLWGTWTWLALVAVFGAFASAGAEGIGANGCDALPFGCLIRSLAQSRCCCCRSGESESSAIGDPVREAVLCPCLPMATDDDAEYSDMPKARSGSRASLLPLPYAHTGDIVAAATGEDSAQKPRGSQACSRLTCVVRVLFHGSLFAYACVLLASGIWYTSSVTQEDARNKFQSALGVFAVAVPLLVLQVASCLGCVCVSRRARRGGVSRRQARDQLVVSCCPPCLLCTCAVGVDDLLDDATGCCAVGFPCCGAAPGRARCVCGREAAQVAGDVGGYVLDTSGSGSKGAGPLGSHGGLARSFAVAGGGDARQGSSSVSILYAGGAGGASGSAAGREAALLDAVDAAIGAANSSSRFAAASGRGGSASFSGPDARARGRSRGRSSMAIAAVTSKYLSVGAVNADRPAQSEYSGGATAAAAPVSTPGSPSLYMPLASAAAADWGADGDSQKGESSHSGCRACCTAGRDAEARQSSLASPDEPSCADACGTGVLCATRSVLTLVTLAGTICCIGCVAAIVWARVERNV